jgi:hypothetical protein
LVRSAANQPCQRGFDRAADCGRDRVIHRLEVSGPAADQVGPELGPAITKDFPEAMDALLARAASTQAPS